MTPAACCSTEQTSSQSLRRERYMDQGSKSEQQARIRFTL